MQLGFPFPEFSQVNWWFSATQLLKTTYTIFSSTSWHRPWHTCHTAWVFPYQTGSAFCCSVSFNNSWHHIRYCLTQTTSLKPTCQLILGFLNNLKVLVNFYLYTEYVLFIVLWALIWTFMYCTVQPYSLVLNILSLAFTHSLTFMLALNAVHAPVECWRRRQNITGRKREGTSHQVGSETKVWAPGCTKRSLAEP